MMPGREAGFFTLEGVSKASSIKFIAEKQGLKLENALGVGDHESDWGFMQLCGEVATLENGSKGIKEKVRERKGFVAPSVNDEGFAEILRHYLF
jgi:hydroxymethylpyrimidine pyrophosphatase-like HAD family hydrolase